MWGPTLRPIKATKAELGLNLILTFLVHILFYWHLSVFLDAGHLKMLRIPLYEMLYYPLNPKTAEDNGRDHSSGYSFRHLFRHSQLHELHLLALLSAT
jgi:hypothetical protein